MYTFAEPPTSIAEAERLWSEQERLKFFSWLAAIPGHLLKAVREEIENG